MNARQPAVRAGALTGALAGLLIGAPPIAFADPSPTPVPPPPGAGTSVATAQLGTTPAPPPPGASGGPGPCLGCTYTPELTGTNHGSQRHKREQPHPSECLG